MSSNLGIDSEREFAVVEGGELGALVPGKGINPLRAGPGFGFVPENEKRVRERTEFRL